ncbi:hypothetical protein LQW54_006901 [Pestalotiopsis sp. IQ-011]
MASFNASSIFEISYSEESPKACLGVYAKRDIQAGEIILQEKRILRYRVNEKRCTWSYIMLRDFKNLTEEERAMVLSLNAHVDPEHQLEIEEAAAHTKNPETRLVHIKLLSVMRANRVPIEETFTARDGRKSTLTGLFPVFSSFSHSCVFNANHTFDYAGGREYEVTVRARRTINKGEEITVGHITPWAADREAQIEKRYGAKCRCALCGSGGMSLTEKRKTLDSLQQIIDTEMRPEDISVSSELTEMQRCMARVVAHEFLGPSPALGEEYIHLMSALVDLGNTSASDRYWQAVRDGVNVARLCLPPNHHTLKYLEERLSEKKVE